MEVYKITCKINNKIYIDSIKLINKVSNKILDTYDNSMIIGYKNVLNKLLEEGYNVKLWQVKDLIYNKLSKNAIINYCGNENIIRRFQNLGKNN